MIRLLILCLLPVVPAMAQFRLYLYQNGSEQAVGATLDAGNTPVGDSLELRFRARNESTAAIALQTLSLAGQGFTISDRPMLPYIIAPGFFVEFRVRFSPTGTGTYSASMMANATSVILRGTGVPAPILTVENSTIGSYVTAGSPIDFGRIQKYTTTAVTMRLANTGSTPLRVNTVTISGSMFRGPIGLGLPADLPPNGNVAFQVSFEPRTSGPQTGGMSIDGRSFILTGNAFEPPMPKPVISVTGPAASAAQPKVSVGFDTIPQTSGNGTLTLDFRPTAAAADDPAIVFLSTGSRRLSFQVKEGESSALFGVLKEIAFQTGTTAGIITLSLEIAEQKAQTSLVIDASPVSLDTTGIVRRVNDIDVRLGGFDNTRTAGRFRFTFYDRAGNAVTPGAIDLDATRDFGNYFAISKAGGAFIMGATFPVRGDATQIGGVDVEVINSAGTVKTSRLTLP